MFTFRGFILNNNNWEEDIVPKRKITKSIATPKARLTWVSEIPTGVF